MLDWFAFFYAGGCVCVLKLAHTNTNEGWSPHVRFRVGCSAFSLADCCAYGKARLPHSRRRLRFPGKDEPLVEDANAHQLKRGESNRNGSRNSDSFHGHDARCCLRVLHEKAAREFGAAFPCGLRCRGYGCGFDLEPAYSRH